MSREDVSQRCRRHNDHDLTQCLQQWMKQPFQCERRVFQMVHFASCQVLLKTQMPGCEGHWPLRVSWWWGISSTFSWLCFCHSYNVVSSSFSSIMEIMKDGSGSDFIVFNALRCCWSVSWRHHSSLLLPFFKWGVSVIVRTCVRWIKWGRM